MSQTSLTGYGVEVETVTTTHRSIVKDAYTTRDDGRETRLELAAWVVMDHKTDVPIKEDDGTLDYRRILDLALDELGADEVARRTSLKSYRDDRGGRAASTVRSYARNGGRLKDKDEGGLPSSHPVKRVLRRWARSNDLGHFQDDAATGAAVSEDVGDDARPIDMNALQGAYRYARSIASQAGFVFVDRSGDGEAVEDNERIDADEVRRHDRPKGDTKAAVLCIKPGGSRYEYEVDLDAGDLVGGGATPPGGW